MKITTRLFSLLFAVALLVCLTACGGNQEPADTQTTGASDQSTTTTAPTTTTTTAPEPTKGINPLTGAADMETDNNRPVAFAVPDESSTITQIGIEHADMYFEAETEAGIPRMLAIFSSVDRIPDRIGPVRSARPHFVNFVDSLDAIYCHIGGSKDARNAIKDLGVNDVESASEIDNILKNSDNYSWNRKAFIKEKVLKLVKSYGYKTITKTDSPFTFGDIPGESSASTLDVRISHSFHIGFSYDEETGLYTKHRVTRNNDALKMPAHTTASGGTITVSNIIVMFDKRNVLDYKNGGAYHIGFDLESGSGLLVSGGTAREIKWRRTADQLSYFEADGETPLSVSVGKTYVCLTDKDAKNQTVVQ